MQGYVIRRLLLIIPTLFVATLIIFLLLRLIPGDIIDQMVSERESLSLTGMDRQAIEHALGLDVPIHVQYARWITGVVHGDFGKSLWKQTPVTREIMARLPVTLELGILAILVALLLAIPIGIFSAVRQDSAGDYLARSFAILCLAVPGFWMATMLIVYGSIYLDWSPPVTLIPFTEDPKGNLGMFIIPAVLMGLGMSGTTMRMTRSMMLEVLRQDYIRTAWAKGLREGIVISRHALKNALIPVVTVIGFMMPVMIGGAVIMEQIFCLPGVGRLMISAINSRDYPIVSGVMIFTASWVLIVNLLVDLTYSFLDPRVRYR
mgnify:CR=1 FL=1